MSNYTVQEIEQAIKKMVRDLCPGDATQMTDAERALIAQWYQAGAKTTP